MEERIERLGTGAALLFVDLEDSFRPGPMHEDEGYCPETVRNLNMIMDSVPDVRLVIITRRMSRYKDAVIGDLRQAGLRHDVYDCISRWNSIGEPSKKALHLIEDWISKRFDPDAPFRMAVCMERPEMVWYRICSWVPVNGYYGLLEMQARMAIGILNDSLFGTYMKTV